MDAMDTKDVVSIAPANGTAKDKSPMAKEQFGGAEIEITISLSSDDEKRLPFAQSHATTPTA